MTSAGEASGLQPTTPTPAPAGWMQNVQIKRWQQGTSLAVQWLRRCASTAGGTGSIPGWGTKIPHTADQPKKPNKKPPLATGSCPCLSANLCWGLAHQTLSPTAFGTSILGPRPWRPPWFQSQGCSTGQAPLVGVPGFCCFSGGHKRETEARESWSWRT